MKGRRAGHASGERSSVRGGGGGTRGRIHGRPTGRDYRGRVQLVVMLCYVCLYARILSHHPTKNYINQSHINLCTSKFMVSRGGGSTRRTIGRGKLPEVVWRREGDGALFYLAVWRKHLSIVLHARDAFLISHRRCQRSEELTKDKLLVNLRERTRASIAVRPLSRDVYDTTGCVTSKELQILQLSSHLRIQQHCTSNTSIVWYGSILEKQDRAEMWRT